MQLYGLSAPTPSELSKVAAPLAAIAAICDTPAKRFRIWSFGRLQVRVEKISVARGGRTIVRDVSFALEPRRPLILRGPNGTGKTTLLRALAGFLPLSAGAIHLDGNDHSDETTVADVCHYIGHLNGIKPTLSVIENLHFWAGYLALQNAVGMQPDVPPLPDVLATFGLESLADIPAGYLSAGQKRRLGLARLQAVWRPIWILDEPTVSLDTASTDMLTAVIDAHVACGGLLIAATHVPIGLADAVMLELARPDVVPASEFGAADA